MPPVPFFFHRFPQPSSYPEDTFHSCPRLQCLSLQAGCHWTGSAPHPLFLLLLSSGAPLLPLQHLILLLLPAASLATHSPIFPSTSFWTCLYAPRTPASWSPACWSETRLSEFTATHATFGVTILEKVIASRCPLTFHHLTRCYTDKAVSIFSNHHYPYHLTHWSHPPLLTSSLAGPRASLPPAQASSCPWPTSRSTVPTFFTSLLLALCHPSLGVLHSCSSQQVSPALAARCHHVQSLTFLARWTPSPLHALHLPQTTHPSSWFQGLSCFDSLLQHSEKTQTNLSYLTCEILSATL